jgi:hypothetical protein
MKKLPSKTIIVDISHLLFRIASVQKINPYMKDASTEDLVNICFHISLLSIYKWYNKFHPDFVVFAFEGGNNWRKSFTAKAGSRKQYKGDRVVDPEMKHYYQLLNSFQQTMKAHTSICCLSIPTMEADDAIAGFCQLYAREDHQIFIISGDKDFTGLLKLPGVKLVNPDNGKFRNQPGDKGYEPDIDFWTFLKCVRGDMGDHVPSAFPRVRETKIRKAYDNEYDRINFMNETWVEVVFEEIDGQEVKKEVTHRVGDLFEENRILLDLFQQPKEQRDILLEGIKQQVEDIGNYSHFHFLRFLNEFDLQRLKEDAMKFVDLFANNQRFLKSEKEVKKQQAQESSAEVKQKSSLLNF